MLDILMDRLLNMLRFTHRGGTVKGHASLPVILACKNRNKSYYVHYDLLVNSFMNPLSMSFHSSRRRNININTRFFNILGIQDQFPGLF